MAVVVGGIVRAMWAIIATRTPTGDFNDAAVYLRMAEDFGHLRLPTVSGAPSALYAPGYPLLLAPVLRAGAVVDVMTPAHIASAINVVAGTVTIVWTALLAQRWLGRPTRTPAAWLIALQPGQVFFVPTAHAETVFTAMFVGLTLWATVLVDRSVDARRPVPMRSLLVFGALTGVAILLRGPGSLLVAMPAMALIGRGAPRAAVLRATAAVALAVVVAAVPWTAVNGLHAGVWTPTSTQNATVLCVGHHDDADGDFPVSDMSRAMSVDCYRHSPWDDPALDLAPDWWEYGGVDEARWYRESSRRGISWALRHPAEEVRLTGAKLVKAWGSDWDALPAGRNYLQRDWTGWATRPLHWLANLSLWLLELAAIAALVRSPRARRAWPIWGSVAMFVLTIAAAIGEPHFRHTAVPFLAVLAGGTLASLGEALHARRRTAPAPST